MSPTQKKPAASRASKRARVSEANDRIIRRIINSLDVAQADLTKLGGSVGSGIGEVRRDLAKLIRDARRHADKLAKETRKDLEKLQKDMPPRPPKQNRKKRPNAPKPKRNALKRRPLPNPAKPQGPNVRRVPNALRANRG